MNDIDQRQREILRLLWREGRMSRWELHERTGVNPNAVGLDVAHLLQKRVIRECPSEPLGPGRPRVPLEINLAERHVIGLAINPGRVAASRLNLRGELVGKPERRAVTDAAKVVPSAVELMTSMRSEQLLGVGLSVTGFVDPVSRTILASSSLGDRLGTSLQPIYDSVAGRPIVLENDMHALAARWLLTQRAQASEDVLLVLVRDGQLGAALLIEGRPNRGCVIGASELGHTRFFVETERCYCGHMGCLERICSSDFLTRSGGDSKVRLTQAAAMFDGSLASPLGRIVDHLAMGIANAVNFVRPSRLILISDFARAKAFHEAMLESIRSRLLRALAHCVRIESWDQSQDDSSESAGWLALVQLYHEGWLRAPSPAEQSPPAAQAARS